MIAYVTPKNKEEAQDQADEHKILMYVYGCRNSKTPKRHPSIHLNYVKLTRKSFDNAVKRLIVKCVLENPDVDKDGKYILQKAK